MQALDAGPHGIEQLIAGERDEIAPGKPRPFAGEDAGVLLIQARQQFIFFREQAQKEQVGDLLDRIHGVVDATRPQDVHELVHLLA